jgi:hypothetical protein
MEGGLTGTLVLWYTSNTTGKKQCFTTTDYFLYFLSNIATISSLPFAAFNNAFGRVVRRIQKFRTVTVSCRKGNA